MNSTPTPHPPSFRSNDFPFLLAVCCLGVSAFFTQLSLMREFVCVFSGNELVFGIVLGNWMLLTGLGSALGRTAARLRLPLLIFVVLQILIAFLPIADVFLLRWLRNTIFLRGAEVGIVETVLGCFILLAPYCLATGYALTTACRLAGIERVYLFDNLGNVVGGVIFLAVFASLLNHFQMLYFAAGINLPCAIFVAAIAGRRRWAIAITILLAAFLTIIAFCDLHRISRQLEYAHQNIVFQGDSPYGSLVVTESAGQINFIENGVPLFSTHTPERIEETVHYAMAQRPHARRVLLISGGVSGTALEVLKYPVEAVDYVELDPLILDAARQFLPKNISDSRIHILPGDGRQYIRTTPKRYDVVIVDMPDPSTSQINRFYTQEFFAEVKNITEPNGVLSFSLGTYENYLSRDLAQLIGIAYRTLHNVFDNILLLPGGRVFFLASKGALTYDVAQRLDSAEIPTKLVGRDYLKGMFTPDRIGDLNRAMQLDGPVNEDFNPILYYYHLRYWLSQFDVQVGFFELLLALALAVYVVRLRPVALVIFCGGFAAASLEVVLLLAFQVLFGSLYYQVGLVVTMFMLGLVIGTFMIGRFWSEWGQNHLIGLAVAIALLAVGLPFLLKSLGQSEWLNIGKAAIPLLTLLLAILVGMEFPLAARIDFQDAATTSARLYTADYLGAALGALLVSTLLIPILGIFMVCLLTAGLNLTAAAVMFARRK